MAGKYTDIIKIDAPSSTAQGKRVDVTVKVKNIDPDWDHVVACVVEVDGLRFIDEVQLIEAGETNSYSGAFLMAGGDVTIYAYSYYPKPYAVPTVWILDDEAQKDVALAEVFEGTITEKELDYEDRWQTFPLYNIPAGTRTRVRITGRNDMASNQKMGAWWQVKDPDGRIVEEYTRWEALWTGPGNEQEFRGGSFDLDKEGTYTIDIELFMNPDDQVCVDDYHGTLCTVAPEVFEGTISRKELKYDNITKPIPVG
ncbi:hypothetical protein ES707_01089 [subsurface metagenome]